MRLESDVFISSSVSELSKADITVNGNHHTATRNHMPHGITQCYLPPDSGDVPLLPQPKLALDLVTPEGCKAELSWVVVIFQDSLAAKDGQSISELTGQCRGRELNITSNDGLKNCWSCRMKWYFSSSNFRYLPKTLESNL